MDAGQVCGWCKVPKGQDGFAASYWGKQGTWCRACHNACARGEMPPKGEHQPQTCEQCGESYTPKQLRPNARFCSRKCSAAARKAEGRDREGHLRRKYGITAADYADLLERQGGGCALCGKRPEELTTGRYRTHLHVDHDHETGHARGLLCPDHNLLLGRFGDNVEVFRRIVDYLERGDAREARALVPGVRPERS